MTFQFPTEKLFYKIAIFHVISKKGCCLVLHSYATVFILMLQHLLKVLLAPLNKYCNSKKLWGLGFGLGSKSYPTRGLWPFPHLLTVLFFSKDLSIFTIIPCGWSFILTMGTLRSTHEAHAFLSCRLWPSSSSPPLFCWHFLFPSSPHTFPVCIYEFFYSCGCVCNHLPKCSWHFGLEGDWFVAIPISLYWRDVRK